MRAHLLLRECCIALFWLLEDQGFVSGCPKLSFGLFYTPLMQVISICYVGTELALVRHVDFIKLGGLSEKANIFCSIINKRTLCCL